MQITSRQQTQQSLTNAFNKSSNHHLASSFSAQANKGDSFGYNKAHSPQFGGCVGCLGGGCLGALVSVPLGAITHGLGCLLAPVTAAVGAVIGGIATLFV